MKMTRSLVILAAAAAVATMTLGCGNKKPPATAGSSVDEIRATNVPPAPPPMPVQPVAVQPVQPVVSDTSPVVTQANLGGGATPAITGNTYTIQKGDTLFKIARARYGDASAVRKIKEANPGLDADRIRPGQKINLP
jgi:nucleoid-associated protein YgaU